MPALKQINCRVECGEGDIPLTEYKTSYGDGHVETFICVPPNGEAFSIHLTSHGYIAEGLAMFVFMDGVAQCNRNRRGLVMPSTTTRPVDTNVDFRVRQKEERIDERKFLGRRWTFAELNTVAVDKVKGQHKAASRYIGTIEVVVLRCHGEFQQRTVPTTTTNKIGQPGPGQQSRHKQSGHRAAKPMPDRSMGLDGADDSPRRRRSRDHLAGLGEAFERRGMSGYEPRPQKPRRSSGRLGHGPADWMTYPPWYTYANPYQQPQNSIPGFQPGASHPSPMMHPSSQMGLVPPYLGFQPPYMLPPWAYEQGQFPGQLGHLHPRHASGGSESDSAASNKRYGSKKSMKQSHNAVGDIGNSGAQDPWENTGAGTAKNDSGWGNAVGNSNDSNPKPGDTWGASNDNNAWNADPQPKQSATQIEYEKWSKPLSPNDGSADTIDKRRKRHSKANQYSRPYARPYWQNWSGAMSATSTQSEDWSERGIYIAPEEPLVPVPQEDAERRGVSHQVQAGKAKFYQHSTASPNYIDSMELPYAVFVFKYRSKDALKKLMPDIRFKKDKKPMEDRLDGMSEQELREYIRNMKVRGDSDDTDMSTSNDSSSDESSKAGTAAKPNCDIGSKSGGGRGRAQSRKGVEEENAAGWSATTTENAGGWATTADNDVAPGW